MHIAQMQLVQRAHCSKCKCQSCHAVQHLHPVVLTLCVTATLRFSCIGTISSRKLSTWRTLMHKDLREPLTRRCKSLNGTASVDQYLGCCGRQSYTVALRSVVFATPLCRQTCTQLAAAQNCIWKYHSTTMRLCHSGILMRLSMQFSYLVAAVWCEAMPTGYRIPDAQAVSS